MNHNSPAELKQYRFAAAERSKGISSNMIYDAVLRAGGEIFKGDRALLDYGAGMGLFLSQLHVAGYRGKMAGTDLFPRPADLPAEVMWYQADLNAALTIPNASYDLIASIETIEHLENPRAVFREFYRLLRPGGWLIVSTPNQESYRSLFGLVFRRHFIAFSDSCYPAHITALVGKDFERIAQETGFSRPRFDYTDCGTIPRMTRWTWQSLSFGLLKGRRFSDNIVMLAQKLE